MGTHPEAAPARAELLRNLEWLKNWLGKRHDGESAQVVADAIAAINGLAAEAAPARAGDTKPVAWRCFHCDEVFTDEHSARLHFGRDEDRTPACQIKGSEHGLVEALRRAENDAADAWNAIHNETTDSAKAYFAQNARHQEQLRVIEQAGYDRGIADAKEPRPTGKAEGNAEAGAEVAGQSETWKDLQRLRQAILGHRPRCRDCADFDGRCQGTGLPCDPTDAAIEVVGKLKAQLAAGAEVAGLRRGIYFASKTVHASRWRILRDKCGYPIISTWIDEAGAGESTDLSDLWRRCIAEASGAEVFVLNREPGEVLKGGWIELGAALACGVPVLAVGIEEFTVARDQRIRHFASMAEITSILKPMISGAPYAALTSMDRRA